MDDLDLTCTHQKPSMALRKGTATIQKMINDLDPFGTVIMRDETKQDISSTFNFDLIAT